MNLKIIAQLCLLKRTFFQFIKLILMIHSLSLFADEKPENKPENKEEKLHIGGVLWSRFTATDNPKYSDYTNSFSIARLLIDFEYKLTETDTVRVVPDFQINQAGEDSWFGLRNGYYEKKFFKNFKATTGIHRIHFGLDYPNHFPEKVLREKEKFFVAKGVGLSSNGLGASISAKFPNQKLFFDTGVYASPADGYKAQTKSADLDDGKGFTFLMGTNPVSLFEARLSFLYEKYRNDASYPKINTMSDQYAAGVIIFYNYGRSLEPGPVFSFEHMIAYDQKTVGAKSRLYELVLGWQWNYVFGTLLRFDRFEVELPGAKSNTSLSRILSCIHIQPHATYRIQFSHGVDIFDNKDNRPQHTGWIQLQANY